MSVSEEDRQRQARQVAVLRQEETCAEGTPAQRAVLLAEVNRRRADLGIDPLLEWWETKTEGELHERARALGLLRPVR